MATGGVEVRMRRTRAALSLSGSTHRCVRCVASNAIVIAALLAGLATATPDALSGQINPNPGFEERSSANRALPAGWAFAGTTSTVALDPAGSRSGRLGLRIRRTDGDEVTAVGRSIPATNLRHTRVTVSGFIRTEGLFPGHAGLLLRFDGADEDPIFVDDLAGRGPTGTSDWTRFEIAALVPAGADRITFGAVLPGIGTAWFDDVSLETEKPVDVSPPTSPAPSGAAASAASERVAYVDRAITLMQEASLLRDSVDWESVRADHLARAEAADDADEVYAAIRDVLGELGDGHSELLTPALAAARDEPGSPGTGPTSPIASERLDGDAGYLRIPGFIGTSERAADDFATDLARRIAELGEAGVCGWIVDLRSNPGGNMWPMLAGLSSLLGPGEVGAFRGPAGETSPWIIEDGVAQDGLRVGARANLTDASDAARSTDAAPSTGAAPSPDGDAVPRRDAPVAVLTGYGTASSGEAVAVAFRGRPNTRSFGQSTRGLSTSNESLALGDGAVLELTTAIFVDRSGTEYGGTIRPDEVVAPAARRPASTMEDPVVRRAIGWLGSQRECR